MSVGNVCNREVVVADRDSNLVDVAKLMREYHVGSVIVVERDAEGVRPVGIVTDRDLVVEILAEQVDPAAVALEDVMTPDPLTATEGEDVYDIIEAMRSRGVRRVPIVDGEGYLVGVLAVDDLLWSQSRELSNIVSLIERQPKAEARRRAHG